MSALPEARDSLTYWESRLERLPRHAVRKRREAREMTVRWRERVSEAERSEYGAGVLGAVLLFWPSAGCRPRRSRRAGSWSGSARAWPPPWPWR